MTRGQSKGGDVQYSSGFGKLGERRPRRLDNQLFDTVEDGVGKTGKGPAMGGGGIEQLKGHGGRWMGGGMCPLTGVG